MRALFVYLQKYPSLKHQMHELQLIYDMGCKRIMAVGVEMMHDRWFDKKYGTDTQAMIKLNKLNIESPNLNSSYSYQPSLTRPFREVLQKISFPEKSIFIDFGCGKGRTLLMASESGFAEVKGVEFSKELCEIAESNLEKFSAKTPSHSPISIIHSDAEEYKIHKNDNVFYFFNPFDRDIVAGVLKNIEASVQKNPRTVFIIYVHPMHNEPIEENSAWHKIFEENIGGFDALVYRRDKK